MPRLKKVKALRAHRCARCEQTFPTRGKLKSHSTRHLGVLKEIRLLQEGHVPQETKLGTAFRGKNKVIVS